MFCTTGCFENGGRGWRDLWMGVIFLVLSGINFDWLKMFWLAGDRQHVWERVFYELFSERSRCAAVDC